MSDGSGGVFFQRLHSAMLGAYDDRRALEKMVKLGFDKSLDAFTANAALPWQVFELCQWFERRSELDDLLRAAVAHAPRETVELRGLFVQRFPPPESAHPPDAAGAPVVFFAAMSPPFSSCCLGLDTVFVNRIGLRNALYTIETGGNRRVLVVTGAERSGKTFTHELIQHVATHLKRKVVWIDLKHDLPADNGPAALAARILTRMGLAVPVSGEHRVPALLDAMVGAINNARGKWWIVLDGFERGSVSHEVRELITGLAIQVGTALLKIRLALLGYDEPLSRPLLDRVHREQIKAIDEAAITHFFYCAFHEHGHEPDPEAIRAAVEIVWGMLPASEPERLRALNQLLCDAVQQLFSPGVAS